MKRKTKLPLHTRFKWWAEIQYMHFMAKFNIPEIQLCKLDAKYCNTWIKWRFFLHYPYSCRDCHKGMWRKGYCNACMNKRQVPRYFVCKECLDRCGTGEESLAVYPRKDLANIYSFRKPGSKFEDGELYDEYECIECCLQAHHEHIAGKYQFG